MAEVKKVAVIGGGVCGLTAVKCCLDEGLLPTCFEKTGDIGGLWNYTEEIRDGGCVNKFTFTNLSKEMMSFSDFPMPKEFPMYMRHSVYVKYLRMYAERFGILQHIMFHTEVLDIKPEDTDTGQWSVSYKQTLPGKPVTIATQIFDAVMVCTGHYGDIRIPDLPGLSDFKGKIVHSKNVKDLREYEDKKVVVVGLSNSAGDVAVELSHITSQVYVSTRTGKWFVGRTQSNGLPFDMAFLKRLSKYIPFSIRASRAEKILNTAYNHTLYPFVPVSSPVNLGIAVNDELPVRVACGSIVVKSDIKQIYDRSVEFCDGVVLETVDAIVFCTGYSFDFPFIKNSVVGLSKDKVDLYKFIFPPELEIQTMAVIGNVAVGGPVPPVAEIQSRFAVGVFKGYLTLPCKEERWKEIKERRKRNEKRYRDSKGHYIQIDYVQYMDDIACDVGCSPNIGKLLFTDPKIALKCLFGPLTSYQFRLHGPGKWSGAREAILTQWDRTVYFLKTRTLSQKNVENKSSWLWKIFLFGCVTAGVVAFVQNLR